MNEPGKLSDNMTDLTVHRGYLLLNMAGAVENLTDEGVCGLLMRFMDCIVLEQEEATKVYLNETKATVH